MTKKTTTPEFIAKSVAKHGVYYIYDKVKYTRALDKVIIICPVHGEFSQTAHDHLCGNGCNKCGLQRSAGQKRKTLQTFINESNVVHAGLYDYSSIKEYINSLTPITIICPKHGLFEQIPKSHVKGHGCPYCEGKKVHINDSLGIVIPELLAQWHHEKNGKLTSYDVMPHSQKKVWWIGECGHEWPATIANRSNAPNKGCPHCHGLIISLDNSLQGKHPDIAEDFISELNGITPDKIAPNNTGLFYWRCRKNTKHIYRTTPNRRVSNGVGCKICWFGKRQERLQGKIQELFPNEKIEGNYRHPLLRFSKSGLPMQLDIFLPGINMAFEYQGEQHYGLWSHVEQKEFESLILRDQEKRIACAKFNINLVEIDYRWDGTIEQVKEYIEGKIELPPIKRKSPSS